MGRAKKFKVEKGSPVSFTVAKTQIGRKAKGAHGYITKGKVYFGKTPVLYVAKIYYKRHPPDQAVKDFRMLSRLKAIGCKVIPAFMVVRPEGRNPILLLTDLRREGRFEVQKMVEMKNVANKEEIRKIVEENFKLAAKHKIFLPRDSWIVAIDKKTRIGKPYISDVVLCFEH
ncbi:MAG: hypothetical protein AB1467_03215 [Candidatus Diapherotrites archaeon]